MASSVEGVAVSVLAGGGFSSIFSAGGGGGETFLVEAGGGAGEAGLADFEDELFEVWADKTCGLP